MREQSANSATRPHRKNPSAFCRAKFPYTAANHAAYAARGRVTPAPKATSRRTPTDRASRYTAASTGSTSATERVSVAAASSASAPAHMLPLGRSRHSSARTAAVSSAAKSVSAMTICSMFTW